MVVVVIMIMMMMVMIMIMMIMIMMIMMIMIRIIMMIITKTMIMIMMMMMITNLPRLRVQHSATEVSNGHLSVKQEKKNPFSEVCAYIALLLLIVHN